MKKIITTIAVVAVGMAMAQAQGLVKIYSTSVGIVTNTAVSSFIGGNQQGGTFGKTATATGGFYYELLVAPMSTFSAGTLASTNPLSAGWITPTFGLGSNYITAGSITGPGANSGAAINPWANGGSSATSDTMGTEMQYLLVGWSSSLGNNWATVSNELATASLPAGFFGVSQMGYGFSGGGGTPASGATSIWGVSASMPGGLTTPFTLFSTVPEPTSLALAALGGASLLLFRRRK
jgi:hypothetical protein